MVEEECTICYEDSDDELFLLNCCTGKKICHDCLGCLRVPLCPYCRSLIPDIKDDPKYRMATSMPETSSLLFMHPRHRDNDIIDSRILRRRLKRLRKLELREEDRMRNRFQWEL